METTPAHKAIVEAYAKELKEGNSRFPNERFGRLHLRLDDIADIISIHIKPTMPGYDDFQVALALGDDDSIQEFERQTWEEYKKIEREVVILIAAALELT